MLAHPHLGSGRARRRLHPDLLRPERAARWRGAPAGRLRGVLRARGRHVAELFEDDDYSASTGTRRPAYERLLVVVEARRVDAIVTGHDDRLHRSPRELEGFIDLVERTGVRLAVVTGGDYDLTTPDGRSRRGSSAPWPGRSQRTSAGGCAASTSSWPSRPDQPASSGGA